MLEANPDRKIDVADALMQRLDRDEQLSVVLPQFKTLADLEADGTMQFFFDLLIYGIQDIPGFNPPYHGPAQEKAVLLLMDLCKAPDISRMTIDSALGAAWTEKRPNYDHFVSISVFQMEQYHKAPTRQPPVGHDLIEHAFKIDMAYREVQKVLHNLRSYAYEYASKSWQKNLKEKERIQLLGPDYRLVLDSIGTLDSEVANELTAALDNLGSENPANWALSALGCRNVLLKLSTILWKAEGDQHQSALLGKSLTLTGDREKNKLWAYIDIHCSAASGEKQQKLKEAHALVQPIYDIGSKGKIGSRFRHGEAQKLVVDTFRLVEMLQDTTGLIPYDGQPITAG